MKKYSCSNCSYQSDLWSVKRHMLRKHKGCDTASINEASLTYNDNGVPNTVFIGEDGGHAPTTVFVGNNQSNVAVGYDAASSSTGEDTPKVSSAMHVDMQHGLGTGGAQDNQTVSIEGYNNIIKETDKWKDAYEDQKQVNIKKDNAKQ